jgi:hypothetical protein
MFKQLTDLKTQVMKRMIKPSYVIDLGHDGDTYLKLSKLYDIIDDLVIEERKKLRAHLEEFTSKKIPATKNWKDNTKTLVNGLIDVEILFLFQLMNHVGRPKLIAVRDPD